MTPERWQQIDQLFHSALERAPQERTLFITEACASDEALKREVESLLKSHERAESFIEHPPSDVAAELLAGGRVKLAIGQQIVTTRSWRGWAWAAWAKCTWRRI